jgi:hypothetical protein
MKSGAVERDRDRLARIEIIGGKADADALLTAKGVERLRHRRRVDRAVLHRRDHLGEAHVVDMDDLVVLQPGVFQRLVQGRAGRAALAGLGAAQPLQILQCLELAGVD